jgi:DHA2 family methylenomycin A resistance protein-like MFS transporter
MAVAQPIGGRLGDRLGRARVYRAGLIAFLVFSIALSLAPNFWLMVALRILQAISGAVLVPNGLALLRVHTPPGQLGKLNGINGSVLSFAAAVGPLAGAAILALASWRWLFPLSVPIVLVTLVLLARFDENQPDAPRVSLPVDWLGTALFVSVLVALTAQLEVSGGGASAAFVIGGWAAVVCLLGAFIWRQRITTRPAADWQLFKTRSFTAASSYILLTNLTMYTTLLMLPFFIKDVQGKGTALAGLLLGVMSVLVAVLAPFGGRLSDAAGRRYAALLGSVAMFAGACGLLAGMRVGVSTLYLAACLAILGVGLGLGVGAANTAAIESAPPSHAGGAAGTSSMMRYVGSIVGAGLLASVLTDGAGAGDIGKFRLVTLVIVVTSGLAVLAATSIHRFAAHDRPIPVDETATRSLPAGGPAGGAG